MSTVSIVALALGCASVGFSLGWVFGGAYARKAFAEHLDRWEGDQLVDQPEERS